MAIPYGRIIQLLTMNRSSPVTKPWHWKIQTIYRWCSQKMRKNETSLFSEGDFFKNVTAGHDWWPGVISDRRVPLKSFGFLSTDGFPHGNIIQKTTIVMTISVISIVMFHENGHSQYLSFLFYHSNIIAILRLNIYIYELYLRYCSMSIPIIPLRSNPKKDLYTVRKNRQTLV